VGTDDDLQSAIASLGAGGGYVSLTNGTHTITENITLPSFVYLRGQGDNTILNFQGTYNLNATGSNAYTTGTVSVSNGSTTVTGSGTSWSSNVTAGQDIKLGSSYYGISSVNSNTELTLGVAYSGEDLSGESYVIATMVEGFYIQGMTLAYLNDAINIQYGKSFSLNALYTSSAGGNGIDIKDSANATLINTTNISPGASPTISNTGQIEARALQAFGSSADGLVLSGVTDSDFNNMVGYSNTSNGIDITNCDNVSIKGTFFGNGGNGVYLDSSSDIAIFAASSEGNFSSGVKLDTSNSNILIHNTALKSNGSYGINVSAVSNDKTIVTGSTLASNTTANTNDSGTNTTFWGNSGIDDKTPNALKVGGEIEFTPGSSVSPTDNGDVVIEATNNTTLTFKLKGSDGTTRSDTLTLS